MLGICRVFGTAVAQPPQAALLQALQLAGRSLTGKFTQTEQDWVLADLAPEHGDWAVQIDCYRRHEEGIRANLNTWAAWLETMEANANHVWLMQHMISTEQLYTLSLTGAERPEAEEVCVAACRFLARETAGVYQVDGQGFFGADGRLLLAE
jgi:hypothetical protein